MSFDFEKFVPREKAIIFDDRVAASSGTLFQIVREFFEPQFLIHQIEYGENLCWSGFRPTQVGDEERGWIRIESSLGVKTPGEPVYHFFDIPHIDVGSISIRFLSPIASRVLIRTNYTPEALSFLFNGLAKYLVWVVNGEDAREAWSRAVSRDYIQPAPQTDAREILLLEAPSAATEQIRDTDRPSTTGTKTVRKTKSRSKRKKTRKRKRTAKVSARKNAKQKIYVPSNDYYFERYRKMWSIIKKTRREYLHPANKEMEVRPNPTIDDLREAIGERLTFRPSGKTVERVILAGSNGLLRPR